VLTMNSVKILHAVRSAITAIAELLVNSPMTSYQCCPPTTYKIILSVYFSSALVISFVFAVIMHFTVVRVIMLLWTDLYGMNVLCDVCLKLDHVSAICV